MFTGYQSKVQTEGSIFTTELVKELNRNTSTVDFVSLLTLVNSNVSFRLDWDSKQMPYFRSTLTKFVLFRKGKKPQEVKGGDPGDASQFGEGMDSDVTDGPFGGLPEMLTNLSMVQLTSLPLVGLVMYCFFVHTER